MSNLTKLEFTALDISEKNYLSWILDVEIHLNSMELGDTLKDENTASLKDRAKAMIFIRRHLQEELKTEYLTVKDPLILWNNLKDRYEHQKSIILPRARYEWINLRFQDYKSVHEYNSAFFKIVSKLQLCGEKITEIEMLDKTLSTFHASNMILQQQYRGQKFQKYSDLITCLLVAEQNNELLMRNHQSRPTGSAPFPEANGVSSHGPFPEANRVSFNDRKPNHGHGRGQGKNGNQNRGDYYQKPTRKSSHLKWVNPNISKGKGKSLPNKPSKKHENACYRCGVKGHWSRTCRTPRHLVDLYQASLKEKGKGLEMNFANYDSPSNSTHLGVSDFFEDLDNNVVNYSLGDGSDHTN